MTEQIVDAIADVPCQAVEHELVMTIARRRERVRVRRRITTVRRGRGGASSMTVTDTFDFVGADLIGAYEIADDHFD